MTFSAYPDKRNPRYVLVGLGFLLSLILSGCSSPPPPREVKLVEEMGHDLWKAQAHLYAPNEYKDYQANLRRIKDALIKEGARFSWFRDYGLIEKDSKEVLKEGERLLEKVENIKKAKRADLTDRLSQLRKRVMTLDRLSYTINEGRLARRSLSKAGLMLDEAGLFINKEEKAELDKAESSLARASSYIGSAEDTLLPILSRYTNRSLIERWRGWVAETILESREKGIRVIIIDKLEKVMTVYKDGRPFKRYEIGLGRNGSSDKLHAGDGATPEGRYKVIKKLDRSRYYKALLLNYPNEEDRKGFLMAKRKGLIPRRASIGGLIEIHGGGKDGMTYGCVGLENGDMDEVFRLIPLGTPVTIVGTTYLKNDIWKGQRKG